MSRPNVLPGGTETDNALAVWIEMRTIKNTVRHSSDLSVQFSLRVGGLAVESKRSRGCALGFRALLNPATAPMILV